MNILKACISLAMLGYVFLMHQPVVASSRCDDIVEGRLINFSDVMYANPKRIGVIEDRLALARKICRHEDSTYPLLTNLSKERLRYASNLEEVEKDLMQMEQFYAEFLNYEFHNYAEVTLLTAELYSLLGKGVLSSYYARKATSILRKGSPHYASAVSLLLQSAVLNDIELTAEELAAYDAIQDSKMLFSWITKNSLIPTSLISTRDPHQRFNRAVRFNAFKGNFDEAVKLINASKLDSIDLEEYTYVDDLFVTTMLLSDILKTPSYRHSFSAILRSKMDDPSFYLSQVNQVQVHLLCALLTSRRAVLFSEAKLAADKLRDLRALQSGYAARDGDVEVEFLVEKLLKRLSNYQGDDVSLPLMFAFAQMAGMDNPLLSYAIKRKKNPVLQDKVLTLERKEEKIRQLVIEIGLASNNGQDTEQLNKTLTVTRNEFYALKKQLLQNKEVVSDVDLPITTVQKRLDASEQLLFTTDVGDTCFLFTLSTSNASVIAFDKGIMQQKLKQHRANVRANKQAEKSGSDLYELLIVKGGKGIETTCVVAEGIVSQLPFSTLYNAQHRLWFVQEQFVPRYLSLGSFANRAVKKVDYENRLAVAYSKFDSNASKGSNADIGFRGVDDSETRGDLADSRSLERVYAKFSFLKGVEEEAHAITGRLSTHRRILKGREARKDHFLQLVKATDWNLLSFSTHTFYPTYSSPLKYPSLLFARNKQDDVTDGFLSADEISSLPINNAFVILAACETAVAADAGGSMNSLLSSFKFAGAQSILATHWKVSNKFAGMFMKHFATYLKKNGDDCGAAKKLWRAQLMALQQSGTLSAPAVWGAWDVYQ